MGTRPGFAGHGHRRVLAVSADGARTVYPFWTITDGRLQQEPSTRQTWWSSHAERAARRGAQRRFSSQAECPAAAGRGGRSRQGGATAQGPEGRSTAALPVTCADRSAPYAALAPARATTDRSRDQRGGVSRSRVSASRASTTVARAAGCIPTSGSSISATAFAGANSSASSGHKPTHPGRDGDHRARQHPVGQAEQGSNLEPRAPGPQRTSPRGSRGIPDAGRRQHCQARIE